MNIYVSNLNANVKDEDLRQLFAAHGEVSSAKVIMDNFTGSSRGFGFVEMPDDTAGQTAIDQLNNSQLGESNISVQVARPKEERKGSYPAREKNFRKY